MIEVIPAVIQFPRDRKWVAMRRKKKLIISRTFSQSRHQQTASMMSSLNHMTATAIKSGFLGAIIAFGPSLIGYLCIYRLSRTFVRN